MQCLNTKNKEVAALLQEYTDILGSENAAYYVLSENNGYGLDKAPDGEPSRLFTDLMEYHGGNETNAIQDMISMSYGDHKPGYISLQIGSDQTLKDRLFKNQLKQPIREILKNINNSNPSLAPLLELISKAMVGNKYIESTKVVLLPTRIVLENRPETKAAGYFDSDNNTIYIYADSKFKGKNGLADTSILHEIIHAFTYQTLINNPTVRAEAKQLLNSARKQLENVYQQSYSELASKYRDTFYGLKNEEEFLSELFSNSRFINELLKLAPTNINNRSNNMVARILNWIMSVFKISKNNSLYEEGINLLGDIMFNYQNTLEGYNDYYANGNRLANPQTSDSDVIKGILSRASEHISFEPNSHTYTNTITGDIYTPVSTVKDLHGYGADVSSMSDEVLAYGEYAAKVGSAIHDEIHHQLTGEKIVPSEVKLSDVAKKMIKEVILPKILSNGDEVLASEQMIVNDPSKIAGTLDLLKKDKNGQVHLMDFKTKARTFKGKGKYGFDYYFSAKKETKEGGKPDASRHDYQLSLYKRMLELSGIKVDHKEIVPIEYTINENGVITEVWIPDLPYAQSNGTIYHRTNNALEQDINKTVLSNDTSTADSEIEVENLVNQSEIVNNILKTLKNQLAIYKVKGHTTKAETIKRFIDELNSKEESEVIVAYIQKALNLLKPLIDEYNAGIQLEKNGEQNVWNLRRLEAWKNYAESFYNLDDIQNYLFLNPKALGDSLSNKDIHSIKEALATAINYKNILENSYKSKGEKLWLNWLSPFTTRIEAEYKVKAEKLFKQRHKGSEQLKDKDAMNQFINKYITDHRSEIDIKSRELLRQQSRIATTSPVSAMTRWLDTIFESTDPIVGSMARAYHTRWMESVQEFNNAYKDLVDLTQELEKAYPSFKNNPNKLYNFMLEQYNGTVRLISSISPLFQQAYENAKQEIRINPKYETNKDRAIAIANWLNENAPIEGKAELAKRKLQVLDDMLSTGKITPKEHKILSNNEKKDPSLKKSWADLVYRGQITESVADYLRVKFNELNWEYRVPNKRLYPNKKWDELEMIRQKNPNDIRIRYYDFIKNLSDNGDSFVPDRFKLNGRIPGMSKVLAERVVSGNVTQQLIEGVKKEFTLRADDTDKGMQMTDELDRPVKFVPIFFTNTLPLSEQSYDVATIYKEWFRSVNNYKYINDILPQLEYTKWVIENRKTIKTDSKGNPVKNVLSKIINNGNSDIDPTSNALITDENLIAQVNAWFDQVVYGISNRNLGTTFGLDNAKMLDIFQKYTSLKIMGINMVSMVNNALMAEVQQTIESFASQYVSPKSYTEASAAYMEDLPNILGDIGSRKITSLTNLLNEHFGVFNDFGEGSMLDNTRVKKLSKLSTLFFTTNLGEHEAQSRFLIAALKEKRALDKNGKDIGSMFDYFTVENDRLVFDKEHKVANFNKNEQVKFSQQVTAILRKMHGNYSNYSKVALQQNGMGKLVLMFRKWIWTTGKRRWSKEYYDEYGQTFSKGYYRDGGTYYYNKVRGFFEKFVDEAKALDYVEKADWDTMTEAEKANVKRFTTELCTFLTLQAMSLLLNYYEPDDKDSLSATVINNIDYQIFRLSTDITFYISPASFMKIIQSPLPSSSVIKSASNFMESLMTPTAKFERGDWKGELKIKKRAMDLLPVVRQIYRLRNIDDEKQLLSLIG